MIKFRDFLKEAEAKKPPAVVPENNRIAMLTKKHDDQVKVNNRAAQEALALKKHHRECGEHELANIHKELVLPYQKAASLHKKLSAHYAKRGKT